MSDVPRVVFDTQLLLRAAANPRSLAFRVVFVMAAQYVLLTADETNAELMRVVQRPRVRQKMGLTDAGIAALVARLTTQSESVRLGEVPTASRDPKDDIFLACAVAGKATHLVSADQDLLVLDPYQGIRVVDLPTFFAVLQGT